MRYSSHLNSIISKETEGQQISEQKYLERLKNEDFGSSFVAKIRKYLWNLTEYPETSLAARVRLKVAIIESVCIQIIVCIDHSYCYHIGFG